MASVRTSLATSAPILARVSIIRAVAEALFAGVDGRVEDALLSSVTRYVEAHLRSLPSSTQAQAGAFFELLNLATHAHPGYVGQSFRGLPVGERQRYLRQLHEHAAYPLATVFEGVRALFVLAYMETTGLGGGEFMSSMDSTLEVSRGLPWLEVREGQGTTFEERIRTSLATSAESARRNVHPRLQRLLELGGMGAPFVRARGAHLWSADGHRYLDFISGGGAYFIGRNHPKLIENMRTLLTMELPDLCVVNPSALGGEVAARLLALAGPPLAKVVFANSGSEATEVAARFAFRATGRRRLLHLEGAFHGRTTGAISLSGFDVLREGMDGVALPSAALRPNDIEQLHDALRSGDVAALFLEPIQGMTGRVLDESYLREAELLCKRYGTLLIADEIQTGLGRTGDWFATTSRGARPDVILVSKALSGGMVPVAAVLMTNAVYEGVFQRLTAGPFYYSTFAENNLAMAASLITLDLLAELDAPSVARARGERLRRGLEALAQRHDVIESVDGRGLMLTVRFGTSSRPWLAVQQRLLSAADEGSFGAAVHLELYERHRVLVQLMGPGINGIKLLPAVVATDGDVDELLSRLGAVLDRLYGLSGPAVDMGRRALRVGLASLRSRMMEPVPAPPSEREAARPLELADYRGAIDEYCQALVVGSGPGGVLCALELAKAGRKVILLEAGPVVRQEHPQLNVGEVLSRWFFESGARLMTGNLLMPTFQARCLGGTSVFNSAICMRPPDATFERWSKEYGLRLSADELAPYVLEAERFMGVAPERPEDIGRSNDLFGQACRKLGWQAEPTRRNVQSCARHGNCFRGCTSGAKLSMDRRGIPELLRAGGAVYTSVLVDRLLMRDHRVVGVEGAVVDTETGRKLHEARILADEVVLAAGALATPLILRRSGLTADAVGGNLRVHPSTFQIGLFDERVEPWRGASQGYHSTEFMRDGIKLEALWAPASLLASRFRGAGPELLAALSRIEQAAVWAAWVNGADSAGCVRELPGRHVRIRFDLGNQDVCRLQEASARLLELYAAAGAREVVTGIRGLPSVLPAKEGAEIVRRARLTPKSFLVGSNHVFGTTAMGSDPNRSVTDAFGKVHGVEGLHVCDTGLFPDSPGANPQLTLMALAVRLGRALGAQMQRVVS